jgi:ornithine cyclodeaminase
MPIRHHHQMNVPGSEEATLLLMPAWMEGHYLGVKIVTVFPGNHQQGYSTINGLYVLFCASTGRLLMQMSADELTARRTAAASALAADYLAPKHAHHHLIIGTGRLSPLLVEAHACVRDIQRVSIWGRNPLHAKAVVEMLLKKGINGSVVPVNELAKFVTEADLISCATLSHTPLLQGEWLSPGTHIDLVGGFTPAMREADDKTILRSNVFVDTRSGAITESGDIVQPLATGVLHEEDILADLYDLCAGRHSGRQSEDEISLFKSVGAACEDLAAAVLVYETHNDKPTQAH